MNLPFLERMLYEAWFWDPATIRVPIEELRRNDDFAKWLRGWGRRGDHAIIDDAIGAALMRLWTIDDHSYGFVAEDTPEIALAVDPAHRRRGVAHRLLGELIRVARDARYPALSLSVDPANVARHLYERAGFARVGESGTSWTYLKKL